MNLFLVLQNTYDELQMALLKDHHTLALQSIPKQHASTRFIAVLQDLLDAHNIALDEIPCMVVNQGPGPFTTLRTVLACANGLSFASKVPLIGVDGLDAFIAECSDTQYPHTVILLNAFGQDVYFAIQSNNRLEKGYHNIDTLLAQIKETIPQEKIRFLGNGTLMFQDKVMSIFGQHAFIPKDVPLYCSIEAVGALGLKKWNTHKTGSHQLLPLYLKKHPLDTHV